MWSGRARAVTVLVALAGATLGGCSSGSSGSADTTPDSVGVTTTPSTIPITTTTFPLLYESEPCQLERQTILAARAEFLRRTGRSPTSIDELVAAHLLAIPPSLFLLVPQSTGPALITPTESGVINGCVASPPPT
ncbi:MAG: hypothetical protein JWM05_61 [Acidimicrobiales bacterium]|nr:hypothetical protein [Acidimicrobiales bacterium]